MSRFGSRTHRLFLAFAVVSTLACKLVQQAINPPAPTFPALFTLAPQATHTRVPSPTSNLSGFPTLLPSPTGALTATPTSSALFATPASELPPPPGAGPGVIYIQNFNDPPLEWDAGIDEDRYLYVERDFSQQAYRWQLQAKRDFFTMQRATGRPQLPEPYYQFSAQVSTPEAPGDMAFGLAFNVQPGDAFYYFKVSADGLYSLLLYQDGEFITLVPDTQTQDVNGGPSASNRLAVIARGDVLELYINDHLQVAQVDTTLRGGTIGLAVELFGGEEATVIFDDLVVCDARCERQ